MEKADKLLNDLAFKAEFVVFVNAVLEVVMKENVFYFSQV